MKTLEPARLTAFVTAVMQAGGSDAQEAQTAEVETQSHVRKVLFRKAAFRPKANFAEHPRKPNKASNFLVGTNEDRMHVLLNVEKFATGLPRCDRIRRDGSDGGSPHQPSCFRLLRAYQRLDHGLAPLRGPEEGD